MTHASAFALVSKIAPDHVGILWNTTLHEGCDTAWAVADQYTDDEIKDARLALAELAAGSIPNGWEKSGH